MATFYILAYEIDPNFGSSEFAIRVHLNAKENKTKFGLCAWVFHVYDQLIDTIIHSLESNDKYACRSDE